MELNSVFQHQALMESSMAAFKAFKLKGTCDGIRFMQSRDTSVIFPILLLKLILTYFNIIVCNLHQ